MSLDGATINVLLGDLKKQQHVLQADQHKVCHRVALFGAIILKKTWIASRGTTALKLMSRRAFEQGKAYHGAQRLSRNLEKTAEDGAHDHG